MAAKITWGITFLVTGLLIGVRVPAVADEAWDRAFEVLETYDWGSDRAPLQALDRAVSGAHGDEAAARQLESRLVEALEAATTRAAKDYLCRQLSLIGSAACVPAVAELLAQDATSHMARYALQRIPDPAAAAALREALSQVEGNLKIGVIHSLGARRDGDSAATLIELLDAADQRVAAAAAAALGSIANPAAREALAEFQQRAPQALQLAAADAYLACAERLLAEGDRVQATAIYRALATADQPAHIRLAATRGLLAATQQTD